MSIRALSMWNLMKEFSPGQYFSLIEALSVVKSSLRHFPASTGDGLLTDDLRSSIREFIALAKSESEDTDLVLTSRSLGRMLAVADDPQATLRMVEGRAEEVIAY